MNFKGDLLGEVSIFMTISPKAQNSLQMVS